MTANAPILRAVLCGWIPSAMSCFLDDYTNNKAWCNM